MNLLNDAPPVMHDGHVLRAVRMQSVAALPGSLPLASAVPAAVDQRLEYLRGKADGKAEALREAEAALALFRSAQQAFEREGNELRCRVDEQAVTLALAMARKVIGIELRDPASFRAAILRSLAQAAPGGTVRMSLNPEDLRLLEKLRVEDRAGGARLPEDLVLNPDPSVGRGGCIIESPGGSVDARIESQLALIETALRVDGELGGTHVENAHAGP